jgi:acetate kinase
VRVLVVNTGSSSAKLSVLDVGGAGAADGSVLDPWDGAHEPLRDAVAELAGRGERIDAVGHRVVHGGSRFSGPARIDDDAVDAIAALEPLAPLHQPRAVQGIEAARAALPGVPHVACFDTAFHAGLPDAAATYALPRAWRERWDLRRRGFHGLSHGWTARRAVEMTGLDPATARVVSAHLGGGASLCAVVGGRSVDTTMGMTPLEGIVMTTRAGSVDPGMVLWLLGEGGLGLDEVAHGLQRESGLAGLAGLGTGGDLRAVLPAAAQGDPDAALAVDVYLHRLRAAIAAMAASAGGIDVLAFTGGAGEHQPPVRAGAVDGLGFLGLALDHGANAAATGGDAEVSAPGAAARTVVVALGEESEIARQVRDTVG